MTTTRRPLNYSTTVPVERTLAEIQAMLGRSGAAAVATTYDPDGTPSGVHFVLRLSGTEHAYVLPVDVDAMHRTLQAAERRGDFRGNRRAAGTFSSPEHARRVAWRVVKDWLEAQLALITAGQARLEQVMLPYLRVDPDRSLFDAWSESSSRAIGAST
jgi:hypothetical protein